MDIGAPGPATARRMRHHLARLQTAPQFAAVLDCLFELTPERTSPPFAELALVDERLIFARIEGERSFRYFVGRRHDLVVNLVGFVTHLGFGASEREYVLGRVDGIQRIRTR